MDFGRERPTFEWDSAKSERALRDRGFDFRYAARIFDGKIYLPKAITTRSEMRYLSIGRVDDHVITIVWTPRRGRIRIISARPASRKERSAYAQALIEKK